jgi:hypothetical protein
MIHSRSSIRDRNFHVGCIIYTPGMLLINQMFFDEESDEESDEDCSECVMQSIVEQSQPPSHTMEELRQKYLSVVDTPTLFRRWVEELTSSLQRLSGRQRSGSFPTNVTTCGSTQFHGNLASVALSQKTIISIGRTALCDIRVVGKAMSRLHTLVVRVQSRTNRSMFAIVDFWSLHGTVVGDKSSTSGDRSIIYVPAIEPFILDMGSEKIQFKTKECIVCMDNPRDLVFNACRHFVVCGTCALRLTHCPLCSVWIRGQHNPGDEMSTYEQKE